MRNFFLSVLILIVSLLPGWVFIEFLVTHPLKMSLFLTLALVLMFTLVLLIRMLKMKKPRWIAVTLAIVAFAAGYTANTKRFLSSHFCRSDAQPDRCTTPGRKYDYPGDLETINLGAWNNHPTVIRALKERIETKAPEY